MVEHRESYADALRPAARPSCKQCILVSHVMWPHHRCRVRPGRGLDPRCRRCLPVEGKFPASRRQTTASAATCCVNLDRAVYILYRMGMTPGPDKQFEPDAVLGKAMMVFWRKGFAATTVSDLTDAMGIGRKSLYETFGNKRDVFIKALERYSNTIVERICAGITDPAQPALHNVRRTLDSIQAYNASPMSRGCMYGVAAAETLTDDTELAGILRIHLRRYEDAFHMAFVRAQQEGDLDPNADSRDLARLFLSIVQGMNIIGRVTETSAVPRSIADAAMRTLPTSQTRHIQTTTATSTKGMT